MRKDVGNHIDKSNSEFVILTNGNAAQLRFTALFYSQISSLAIDVNS